MNDFVLIPTYIREEELELGGTLMTSEDLQAMNSNVAIGMTHLWVSLSVVTVAILTDSHVYKVRTYSPPLEGTSNTYVISPLTQESSLAGTLFPFFPSYSTASS